MPVETGLYLTIKLDICMPTMTNIVQKIFLKTFRRFVHNQLFYHTSAEIMMESVSDCNFIYFGNTAQNILIIKSETVGAFSRID